MKPVVRIKIRCGDFAATTAPFVDLAPSIRSSTISSYLVASCESCIYRIRDAVGRVLSCRDADRRWRQSASP
jgi:hypothetical protein